MNSNNQVENDCLGFKNKAIVKETTGNKLQLF